MAGNLKILIYGSGNVNPVNILVGNIRKYSEDKFFIDGLNLFESIKVTERYQQFDNIYKINTPTVPRLTPTVICKTLLSEVVHGRKYGYYIKLFLSLKVKEAYYSVKNAYNENLHLKFFRTYDIINLHWVTEKSAAIVALAPSQCKVVLSFWGSDLMANAGLSNYDSLLKAIVRADVITVHSVEMREIFLSKFGRQFKSKVRLTFFGQNDDLFNCFKNNLDELRQVGRNLFIRHGVQIGDYKYLLKIGYSGTESQNHLAIIDQCYMLPEELKRHILIVLPMTYDANDSYVQKVEAYSQEKGLASCVFKDYLSREEALSISFVCHLMLNLRDNDAFNNSMIETLVAGNILISGGWLPYSALRENRIHFHEIYDLDKIHQTIRSVISNIEVEFKNSKANSYKIERLLSGERCAKTWSAIYREA